MNFNLSEETVMMQSYAARYLKEKCSIASMKEAVKSEKGYSESVYKEMSDMGWLGLVHEEKYGGSNGSFFDLFILFEEIGKVLVPSPFYCSAVISGLILRDSGSESLKESCLPAVISAGKVITMAFRNQLGYFDYSRPELKAVAGSDGSFLLKGSKTLVPYAHIADMILVCADVQDQRAGGSTLFLVDGDATHMTKTLLNPIGIEKSCTVVFDNVSVSADQIVGAVGQGTKCIEKVINKATVLKCGEMIGGMGRVLEMTMEYAKERKQFGKPLASLQVVQHYCVDMYTYLETARMITYQAASLMSDSLDCAKEVAMAKSWCNEAYKKSTLISHQIHGGIGFCEEHDLGLFYKHAKTSELEWGNTRQQHASIADAMGI